MLALHSSMAVCSTLRSCSFSCSFVAKSCSTVRVTTTSSTAVAGGGVPTTATAETVSVVSFAGGGASVCSVAEGEAFARVCFFLGALLCAACASVGHARLPHERHVTLEFQFTVVHTHVQEVVMANGEGCEASG